MKMRQSSVTSLLMLCVLSATLIYSLVFFTLLYSQIGNTLELLRVKSLNEQVQQLSDYLEKNHAPTGTSEKPPFQTLYNSPGGYQYIVRDIQNGKVVLQSSGAFVDGFPVTAPAGSEGQSFSFYGPNDARFLGTSIRKDFAGRQYVIEVAQSEESIRSFADILTHTFLQRISLFGIPFLFLLMLVIALSIKLIMSPLTKALKEAHLISFSKPDIRLNDTAFPQEIKPLAHAVNDALDRLERGIEAQKDFIANAAHELRTPLSILRTHVDLLEDKTVAARMRDDVDSMVRLVSQLLDTARLESPEQLEMHSVDLAEIVRKVSEAIWPLMIKDERAFEVAGIENPTLIIGNFDAIYRALRNLLENALKYSPRGTPIHLSLAGHSISIRDFGKGIADDYKERIFEKFSRRDMQQGSGAGLGLFIVRKIMQLHSGAVGLANAPDGGAIFTLQFPSQES